MASFGEAQFLLYFVVVSGVTAAVTGVGVVVWRLAERRRGGAKEEGAGEADLAAAREQAQRLLREAEGKAQEIVGQTHVFSEELQQDVEELVRTAAGHALKETEDQLRDVIDKHDAQTSEAVREVTQAAQQHVGQMSEVLDRRLKSLEQQLSEMAQTEQRKMRADLTAERERLLAGVEQRLVKRLPEIVEHVVGRSIPLADHEKLVREALGKVKF